MPVVPTPLRKALIQYHHRAVHRPRVQRIATALARQIGAADSLLDVGCGSGEIAQLVAAKVGAKVVRGVDVKVRPDVAIEAVAYDGEALPFESDSVDVVTLSDVLHHCPRPAVVLRECLRVARRSVVIKDHFAFGPLSRKVLLWMDVAGNEGPGVHVEGTYWDFAEWTSLAAQAGGRITRLEWPLKVHDLPFRWIARSELQFVATVEREGRGA